MTPTEHLVVGFLFRDNGGEVALIAKKRPRWQCGRLNGIGGHCHDGEASAHAMQRECLEETGADVSDWVSLGIRSWAGGDLTVFYSHQQAEIRTMTDEVVAWFPVDRLADHPTIQDVERLVKYALRAPHIIGAPSAGSSVS